MAFNKKDLPIDKNLVHLYIVYGLPGSGKTTFLHKKFDFRKAERDFEFFNMDFYSTNQEKYPTVESYFKNAFNKAYIGNGQEYNFVVDGLFRCPSDVHCFVNNMANYYDNCFFEVKVYAWNEDRIACISNDEQRLDDGTRVFPSADTIKNAVYVPLTYNDLRCGDSDRIYYLPVDYQTIHKATAYEKFFNPRNMNNDELRSEKWCVGGETRDCYGNTSPARTEAARDFEELDTFLERVCPEISFLLYKKIKRECVTLEKQHNGDYYGSYDYNFWKCDLKKLYQILKDSGHITED